MMVLITNSTTLFALMALWAMVMCTLPAEDLYLWDQALYTEKLVKKATFAEAINAGKLNNGKNTEYGFGWFIREPRKIVAHTGGWVGFGTEITRYLDKKSNHRCAG
jgi:N-acyl-D-amino-acid deacylase